MLVARQLFYILGYLEALNKSNVIDKSEISKLNNLIVGFFKIKPSFFMDIEFDYQYYEDELANEQYEIMELNQSFERRRTTSNPYYDANLDLDQQCEDFYNYIPNDQEKK